MAARGPTLDAWLDEDVQRPLDRDQVTRVSKRRSAAAVHRALDEAVRKVGATEQGELAQQIRPTLRQPLLNLSGKAAEHPEPGCYPTCSCASRRPLKARRCRDESNELEPAEPRPRCADPRKAARDLRRPGGRAAPPA